MNNSSELKDLLNKIDRRGYPAYKDTRGAYRFPDYILSIDHVQSDPFAPPSRLSITVSGEKAGFPKEYYDEKYKKTALEDYLIRNFRAQVDAAEFRGHGSGKSGLILISRCGQEILERSACKIDEKSGGICIRIEVGFPARGRIIDSAELIKILFNVLPACVGKALFYRALDKQKVKRTIELAQDQHYIRSLLDDMGLAAFVADGSILPRESGVSDRPMKNAVKFVSPETMSVSLTLPNRGKITGMGIKKGVSLIVGGGYHGKSTLLAALEVGVYNHIAGDGREFVITDGSAMKLRAEDGRNIKNADISLFINNLPNGKDTRSFYTEDASGSTSQAANVIEAIESGSKLFLIDEDTSATNFMIRDELMQKVVRSDSEPITPFIDRVRQIYEQLGISSIIVVGSCGSYFDKADCILQMEQYKPKDITEFAKNTAEEYLKEKAESSFNTQPRSSQAADFSLSFNRCPAADKAFSSGERIKIKANGLDGVCVNRETIDLRLVEQLADHEQLTALGYMLVYAEKNLFDKKNSLRTIVDRLEKILETDGFEGICQGKVPSNMAAPRRQEIFAMFNRFRALKL